MISHWHDLSWLPDYQGDFKQDVQNLTVDSLETLVRYKLTDNQLNKLSRAIKKQPELISKFEKFRLCVIGNANCDFIKAALEISALRLGIALEVHIEPLGRTVSAVLDKSSEIYSAKPDAVLLAYTSHIFNSDELGNADKSRSDVDDILSEVSLIREALKENSGAKLLVQTIPSAPTAFLGSLEGRVSGSQGEKINTFNEKLVGSDVNIIDVARLAQCVGLSSWYDMNYWHWAKVPFSNSMIPLYADFVARHIGAIRGKSKKCLVLDLDNTLWGGVIGDDGIEKIEIGQGSPKGEAYLSVQKMALELKSRGVVLAVCSKNDEENARLPFQAHPEMLMKEGDFGVFQANWNDKASNIQAIADALSLTLDSMVFLDDNPAEREIVRRELPSVAVPEVPDKDPALWPAIISAAGYFETIQFTDNDLQRASQYAANAKRNSLKVTTRDLDSYLKSLEMVMEITSCKAPYRARAVQLINRSNQCNLTTRRYTDEQLEAMENDPSYHCFAARLKDKFGDNGIISVVICKEEGDAWYIDSWLMSCRVLERRVEESLLAFIVERSTLAGKKKLIGHYIPSSKNQKTERHYEKLGFEMSEAGEDGIKWTLELDQYKAKSLPIEVIPMLQELDSKPRLKRESA